MIDISGAQRAALSYPFADRITDISILGNGHINRTFKVNTNGKDAYILQAINTSVFRNPEQMMENISMITGHISSKVPDPSRNVMQVIKSNDKKTLVYDDNGVPWRAYVFVDNTICKTTCDTPEQLRKVGSAFGAFQRQLSDFDFTRLYETIPHFHDTSDRYLHFDSAVKSDVCGRAALCRREIEFYSNRRKNATLISSLLSDGKIPLRAAHNDAKLSNILLDSDTYDAVCVIDLDTVMPGSVLFDFGDAIRSGASNAAEDETDVSKCFFRVDMYNACREGFLEALGDALTDTETALFPLAAYTITLETGLRFLTDYLNGDVYFRTDFETHNLDRARNQMYLVLDMESRCEEFDLKLE